MMVVSGAFKVVALNKEQLREISLKKQSQDRVKCDKLVIQPKDITYAIDAFSKSP